MVHEIKIQKCYADAIAEGRKNKEDFPEDAIMCPPLEKKCDPCLCLNCDQFQYFCKPCDRCHGENVRPIFSCEDCKKICKKGLDN